MLHLAPRFEQRASRFPGSTGRTEMVVRGPGPSCRGPSAHARGRPPRSGAARAPTLFLCVSNPDCVAVPAPLGRRGNRGGREGCAAIDYTAIIAGLIPGLIGFLLVCRAHAGLRISCMKSAFPCFLEYLSLGWEMVNVPWSPTILNSAPSPSASAETGMFLYCILML